ncbi:hypothetical protein EV356DRAFT_514626 [Viridothelium virens]|uniref:Serine hydrolase domain-containing protein n=1 Tax=Viridothelium virens TaxID=1048519 RepID=A0A6A6HAZ7_VIRVR|nr:hypothetical protein EV356DRAFT_514626 [Viridothelium virens]
MPSSPLNSSQPGSTLHLPRILCLHGGGVTAEVFSLQCRTLIQHLGHKFRFCFADGPFPSTPGPGMIPTFQHVQTFRRWLRWSPEHPDPGPDAMIEKIDENLHQAMDRDDQQGGTGDWVALMGFSQGAKVCASLLLRQQIRTTKLGATMAGSKFKFAVLLAGRAPLLSLDVEVTDSLALVDANELTTGAFANVSGPFMQGDEHVLCLPTLHVHGMKDPGLALHRQLLKDYCKPGTTRVVEWDGDHRVPIKTKDVAVVAAQILALGKETGVTD